MHKMACSDSVVLAHFLCFMSSVLQCAKRIFRDTVNVLDSLKTPCYNMGVLVKDTCFIFMNWVGEQKMKIVVLMGSPNRQGSSNLLARQFKAGAESVGHNVQVVDAAHAKILPCTGCLHCGYDGPCILKDDMEQISREVLSADLVAFVTPLYYFGMPAQMKLLIDRFCSMNGRLQKKQMQSVLIATAGGSDTWSFLALETHYFSLVQYLHFQDKGRILAAGCGTLQATSQSEFPSMAYALGQKLAE